MGGGRRQGALEITNLAEEPRNDGNKEADWILKSFKDVSL